MKKAGKIIIIILVAIILIWLIYSGVSAIIDSSKCAVWNNGKCDKQCTIDIDCKHICGCGCVNKNEVCSYRRHYFFVEQMIFPDCARVVECNCINNKCELNNS